MTSLSIPREAALRMAQGVRAEVRIYLALAASCAHTDALGRPITDVSITDLGRATGMSPRAVAMHIRRLIEDGYITRTPGWIEAPDHPRPPAPSRANRKITAIVDPASADSP